MTGALAHDQAQRLRAALEEVLGDPDQAPDTVRPAREAFEQLVGVLESSPEAVVFPSESTLSTQEAAELLGVSRMTVVRLIDRGHLTAEVGGVHRRVLASELARYRASTADRREAALHRLAGEIGQDTPPDTIVNTR